MKKLILNLLFTVFSLSCASSQIGENPNNARKIDYPLGIRNITAVIEDKNRVAAVIEFSRTVKNRELSLESFRIEGYKIIKIYASSRNEKSSEGSDGNYVIIELDKNVGESFSENSILKIIQKEAVVFSNGERYRVLDKVLMSNKITVK